MASQDAPVWAKNLLLGALCAVGVGVIAGGLWPRGRLRASRPARKARVHRQGTEAVAAKVDREFAAYWKEKKLKSALPAKHLTILRRLSLGLTGVIPSLEEIRVVEKLRPEKRIGWWLDHLLDDRRFADHVGERLARMYVGVEDGPFIVFRRRRFVTWLSDQLAANEPYDKIVRSLISDRGIWTSSPSVNFLTVTLNENRNGKPDPIRLAGRTSRAFLGMRIDCLQCHDDRLGTVQLLEQDELRSGTQEDFHQLAAFFGESRVSILGLTDNGRGAYKYLPVGEAEEQPIVPATPFLPELRPQAGNLREQLAAWVTHKQNKPFARTAVNRVWAILFGRPLVEPIDDIPLSGEFPPGLETLADDFVQHRFDIHRLIRIIAATRVYQQDSRADFPVTAAHEQHWAVFPLTRLRPDQVAGALIQASSLTTINADSHIFSQLARYFQQNDFVRRYGDAGEDEFDPRSGTIPQRLLMMNGRLVRERIQPEFTNASNRLAQMAPDDDTAIETAFLILLTRRPNAVEREHFKQRLNGTRGRARQRLLEDICWALLNCTEFSWNH